MIFGGKSFRWISFFGLCLISVNTTMGQLSWQLHGIENLTPKQITNFQLDSTANFTDEKAVRTRLQIVVSELHQANYLAASLDSISCLDSSCEVWLHIGAYISTLNIKNGNISTQWWSEVRTPQQVNSNIDAAKLTAIKSRFLAYAEQHGYPFARVWFDSITVSGTEWTVSVMLETGAKYTFGDIKIQGSARISPAYIALYTGLRSGTIYNYALLQTAEKRLRELPFLTQQYAPRIQFNGDKANITFYLSPKNASRFDALLGLQPTNNATSPTKFVLTGNLSADIINALGYGEQMMVDFRQLRPQTQQLRTEINIPYPLKQPIGLDGKFSLYKQDTTYLDVSWEAGVRIMSPGLNYVRLFYQYFGTSLLEVNTNQVLLTRKLPQQLDVRRKLGGIEIRWQQLDFRFNPRKGWTGWAQVMGGLHEIKPNTNITNLKDNGEPDFDFTTLYQGRLGQKWHLRTETRLEKYFPLPNSTIRVAAQAGYIADKSIRLKNDLFRIGGYKILRGFDEESQYVSSYGISTLEYRLLIGQYGYLHAFGDYGWVQQNIDAPIWQQKIGFGAGIAVETRAGILNFTLAVGKDGTQPTNFRSVKTHIGYVNIF